MALSIAIRPLSMNLTVEKILYNIKTTILPKNKKIQIYLLFHKGTDVIHIDRACEEGTCIHCKTEMDSYKS